MFKIHVPAGEEHQGYSAIFNANPGFSPRAYERPSPSDAFYGMWVAASCVLSKYPEMPVEPKMTRDKAGFYLKSKIKPTVALEDPERPERPMNIMESARKFDCMFHDLHWIGLTPDQVIRFVPKTVLFDIHEVNNDFFGKHTILVFKAVMMKEADIDDAIRRLSDERCRALGDLA